MPSSSASKKVVGILVREEGKLVLQPSNKKGKSISYDARLISNANEGDIVLADLLPQTGSKQQVDVKLVLGQESTPGILSTISLHEQGLRDVFSQAALKQAKSLTIPELGDREDLRSIPLVTVDGETSRDFDDAIFAEKTQDGGMHLIVAIADVSWYVHPGDALDQDAYQSGNSTYFPDRAIPMLPEELSNGLCSLKPNEDRAVMTYHLWIDKEGNLTKKKINRGLMRSVARLTYEQLQAAKDGNPDAVTAPLMDTVVNPLYAAHAVLKSAATKRGMLNLEMPEYTAVVNDKGEVVKVAADDGATSHDVIAQFMILANVAGDQALDEAGALSVHRHHSSPPEHKTKALLEYLSSVGLELPADKVGDSHTLTEIMEKARKMPDGGQAVIKAIARAQAKAVYDAQKNGHFGLALQGYGHHTSPIRRYSDLVNQRSLVSAFNMGAGGLSADETARIQDIATHVTDTEIASTRAARAADERYAAAFLKTKVGTTFKGRVTSVIGGGLFVRLSGVGAEGLLPVGLIGGDFYNFDTATRALVGTKTGKTFKSGDEMIVRVKEANPLTGSVLFTAANDNRQNGPRPQKDRQQKNHRGHRPR